MTSPLEIRRLREEDRDAFLAGIAHWDGESLDWYSFVWKEGMSYEEMLKTLRNEEAGVGLADGWVPSTMLYAFLGDQIVGRVSVRHDLNENLRRRGGHIGYAVAPAFRKQGVGTMLLQAGLRRCQELGITDVLITCAETNVPSRKMSENAGGVLEELFEYDDEMSCRYTVQL